MIGMHAAAQFSGPSPEYLFLLWEHARVHEAAILRDLRARFTVRAEFEIQWSTERFADNLQRFYGERIGPRAEKVSHGGTGPFLVVLVRDEAPVFERWRLRNGLTTVNRSVASAKADYRRLAGGYRVHASDTPTAAMRDAAMLLGVDARWSPDRAFVAAESAAGSSLKRDVEGIDGWDDLEHLFRMLGATIEYVVLRNHEGLPRFAPSSDHPDIDLLVADRWRAAYSIGARPAHRGRRRVQHLLDIGGSRVEVDLRSPGDRYIDSLWATNILRSRVVTDAGVFVPDLENQFYSLLYHALAHKGGISDDYRATLARDAMGRGWEPSVEALGRYLRDRGYRVTVPRDYSVGRAATRSLIRSSRRVRWIPAVVDQLLYSGLQLTRLLTLVLLTRNRVRRIAERLRPWRRVL